MITKKILKEYKEQNPAKYTAKFGTLDPEILEGVIGMTNPTAKERKEGKEPEEIWKGYSLAAIRKVGGVKITPAPLLTEFGGDNSAAVDAEVSAILGLNAKKEEVSEVTA